MTNLSVVLAINGEIERVRMLSLLEESGWNVACISQDSLPNMKFALPALVIINATHDGIQIIDTIARLLDLYNDLAVIFVLPKFPQAPSWGQQFKDKKVSFFTFGYADDEFTSFVRVFADSLGIRQYREDTF